MKKNSFFITLLMMAFLIGACGNSTSTEIPDSDIPEDSYDAGTGAEDVDDDHVEMAEDFESQENDVADGTEQNVVEEENAISNANADKSILKNECSSVYTDVNGYNIKCTIRYTDWVVASNTDEVMKAWKATGSKNEPDFTNFDYYNSNQAIFFGTLELENVTEGWDLSESTPFSTEDLLLISFDEEYYNEHHEQFNGEPYSWIVEMNGELSYKRGANGGNKISPLMKSNHWGPIRFAIQPYILAFSPEYTDGNPAFNHIQFTIANDWRECVIKPLPTW